MPEVSVNGRELYYRRLGAGPPLLLVQGLGGHGAHWGERFPAALARNFELIVLDNVGTGRSARLERPVTIAGLADDAAGVLEALAIERAHVVGLSMGGMVAQELALGHRERLERLTLIGTSPSAARGVPGDPEVFELLTAAWSSGDRERALRAGFEVNVSAAHAADPEALAAWRTIATDRPVALAVLTAQLEAVRGHDALDRLRALDCPTLILHGSEDRMLPVGNAELLADAIAGARVERFEGCGHLLYLEQPERAAESIVRFSAP